MKTGIIVGKFLPLHNGHLYFINKSATQVDKLIVVVDESDGDKIKMKEAGLKYPDLRTRTKWLTSIYKDTPHIEIVAMSEEGIRPYPHGWADWAKRVRETVGVKPTHIFTSDADYKEGFKEHFPDLTHVFYDNDRKSTNGLSATKIRNDINGRWNDMPSIVRSFFTKKIVIVGGESTGKTTLVKAMAKAFGTSWSEEYGRTFCENELGSWFDKNQFILTDREDYEKIVIKQSEQNEQAIRTANRFTLIDTDAIYTQFFFANQYNRESDLIKDFINKQKYEYIYIFLEDKVKFVQDGFRNKVTKYGLEEFYKNELCKDFDYRITGSTYLERFDQLFEILKKETGNE